MRFRSLLALPAILAAMAFGGTAAEASTYVAPGGADTNACTQTAPCASFSRAASLGDPDVQVASGSYGNQIINAKPAAKTTIHPSSGSVSVAGLDVAGATNIEVRDMNLTRLWSVDSGAQHIVLRNLKTLNIANTGTAGFIQGATDLQILGGEIGYVDPGDGIQIWPGATNSNIVIDGLYMHDLTRNNDGAAHDDCIQTANVNGLIIRNSTFSNCGTQGLFFNPFNGATVTNITVENNFLEKAQLGYNILYVGEASNILFRNNSITDGFYVYSGSSGTSSPGSATQVELTLVARWPPTRPCSTTTSPTLTVAGALTPRLRSTPSTISSRRPTCT